MIRRAIMHGLLAGGLLISVAAASNPYDRVPPYRLSVNGAATGVWALAAVEAPGGLVARQLATITQESRASTVSEDQQGAARTAWLHAANITARADRDAGERLEQDAVLNLPGGWVGQSAGLAYALAYLDSWPMNRTPGSLAAGRRIAATGWLHSKGVGPVGRLDAKIRAASDISIDIVFVPKANLEQPTPKRIRPITFTRHGMTLVAVSRVEQAVRWLCRTGGTGQVCDRFA